MFASQDLTAILLHANQRSNNSALSLSSLHACVYKMDFGSYSCNTVSTVLTGVTTSGAPNEDIVQNHLT